MKDILNFLHLTHHMKRIERFKDMPFWEDSKVKRWDSNAEHSYRMAMMAILLAPKLDKQYDIEKLLKMILIHDIVEVTLDDKFPFKEEPGGYSLPENYVPDDPSNEIEVFKGLMTTYLEDDELNDYVGLFSDFVNAEIGEACSNEAKLAVALDRIEASLQVSDYIKLNEFEITDEHSKLQIEYLKSKSDIDEIQILKLVEMIEEELMV